MTTIGAAWVKVNDETGETTIHPQFDEAILPFTITKEKKFMLKSNKNKTKETQPDFWLDTYIPKPKETETAPF